MTNNGCTTDDCPPRAALERLVADDNQTLPEVLSDHVRRCKRCHTLLDRMTSDPELATRLAQSWMDQCQSSHFLPPLPPSAVPGYLLCERISEGAQGVVYRASSSEHAAACYAVKVCRPCDRKTRFRFEREAAILQQIRHSSVPRVHNFGVIEYFDREMPYIVLDYIRGETISEYVKIHKPNITAIVELIARCCEPLQSAHASGIVHRDIKPGNILVDTNAQPVLIDFGIAHCELGGDTAAYVTSAQQVLGTLDYMSPEQLRGDSESVGPWSDVFSLGILLFELLTARHPYESVRRKPLALLRAMEEPLSPSLAEASHWRNFPLSLQQVITAALSPDPENRYCNASQLHEALINSIRHSDKSRTSCNPKPSKNPWQHLLKALIPALLVASVTGTVLRIWS